MSGPLVETAAGTIEGTSHPGYERFLGIPYARPPIGRLRFRGPEAPEPHRGVLLANAFGPHAPQLPSVLEEFLGGGAPIVTDEAECLRLNVWTPKADGAKRPVMVWIHGGGFTMGTSATPWYDGERFAVDHDVVLVSFNYRLGVLGFTYLAELGGADFAGSGSVGIQDAAAALRWVAENVASFGGDPGNVTIFGESAGAMSVGTLLALPEAKGLFHKAILQSGAASTVLDAGEASRLTAELLSILGLGGAGGSASGVNGVSVTELQELSVQALLEAHQTLARAHAQEGLVSRPVVDGTVLDRHPNHAVGEGAAVDIPILIGTNLDEWRLFGLLDPVFSAIGEEDLESAIGARYPADPALALHTYRKRMADATPAQLLAGVMTDSVFRIPAIRLAEAQHRAGGTAWMYLFTWPTTQLGGQLGSCHGLEIPYVFNTLDRGSTPFFVGDNPPTELAGAMNASWAAFARNGDPGDGALGAWPPYEPGPRSTMILDVEPHLEDNPVAEERELWEGPSAL
jgi:para-nitrobenzyl esterase